MSENGHNQKTLRDIEYFLPARRITHSQNDEERNMSQLKHRVGGIRTDGLAALAAGPELLDGPSTAKITKTVEHCTDYDYGRSTVPWHELDQLVNATHDKPELREQIERELARLLEEGVSLACKQEICRRLWVIGSNASLPSLEKMLTDSDVHTAEAACYAISNHPSKLADEVLQKSLGRHNDAGLVAIITLVGDRRVANAVGRLTSLAKQAFGEAEAAAIEALGKIASGKAIEALVHLHAEGGNKGHKVSHALLASSQKLLSMDKKLEAELLLKRLSARSELAHIRRGAKLALQKAG